MTGFTILMAVFHEDVVVITKLSWGAPSLLIYYLMSGEQVLAHVLPGRMGKPRGRSAGIALE